MFARDPDALIDLVELELNDDILKQEKNKAVCKVCEGWLYKYDKLYHASQDDLCSETQMLALCREYLENDAYECVIEDVGKARKTVESRSAWRIEGTLREFPKFTPVNLWFKYPVHDIDNIGVLKDIAVDDGICFCNIKRISMSQFLSIAVIIIYLYGIHFTSVMVNSHRSG